MIQYTARNPAGKWGMIPDYPADLNAMHDAEKSLGDGYRRVRYLDTLGWVCRRDGPEVPWLECPFATAAQRAEAFLIVFKEWREEDLNPENDEMTSPRPTPQDD